MKTRLTLRPGQNGTKKLVAKYGERLLAVRYRYDASRRVRLKTVELVEEELPWMPPLPAGANPERRVAVRIDWFEHELRALIKQAGGRWDPDSQVWELSLGEVHALDLRHRIVG